MEQRKLVADESLMASYQRGDASAFDELVDRHHGELYAFISRFVGDRTLAEDIVQETFLQVHLSAASFDPEQRFRPWLFTIAANKARDRLRRQARRPVASLDASIGEEEVDAGRFIDLMVSGIEAPSSRMEDEEVRQAVRKIIDRMPAPLKEVLILSYFHNFGYREIADIIGVPLGTVKSRLHSAVKYFSERWKRYLDRNR